MPNYTNTVIPHSPSKTHNIFLLSLYDLDPTIYDLMKMSYGSSINMGKNNASLFPAYLWDLYLLADRMPGSQQARYDHKVISAYNPWKPLFAKSFNDDSGSEVYRRLSSFLPITLENSPSYSAQSYSGSFSFSPLINIGINNYDLVLSLYPDYANYLNDQNAAEMVIYLASKIPIFPLMICSSIKTHASFGPIFLNRIAFSVRGGDSFSSVNIDCNFLGGKILMAPQIALYDATNAGAAKKKPGIEPIIYNEMNDLDNTPIKENAADIAGLSGKNYDFHRYRSASLLDFVIDLNYHETYTDLKLKVDTYKLKPPTHKIIDFNMQIDQTVDLQFTVPYTDTYKRDDIGPKFASMTSREVSGSITYFCYNSELKFPNSTGLSVYFGGPFFYAMKNVDWSNPVVTITPGGGYTHVYKFKARVPVGTYLPNQNIRNNMAEFSGTPTVSIDQLISEITNNLFGIFK